MGLTNEEMMTEEEIQEKKVLKKPTNLELISQIEIRLEMLGYDNEEVNEIWNCLNILKKNMKQK